MFHAQVSFEAKMSLVAATFMSVLDYGDVINMHASSQCLYALDIVYHGALRFITNLKTLTRHCVLVCFVHLKTKTLACFYL